MQIYAGPYVAFGLSGNIKYEFEETEYGGMVASADGTFILTPTYGEIAEDREFSKDEKPYNGFDTGLNFGIGYKVGSVMLNAGYSLGFGSIFPKYEGGDTKVKNRVISISATYLL